MKGLIIGLVVALYVIPFIYMLLADLFDIYKRLAAIFSLRLKPALIVLMRSFIN
jgi:hypothetical protein